MKSAMIRTVLVACLLILLAQGPHTVAAAENSPYPADDLTPLYEKAARHILGQLAGPHKGYVLVFGAGEGRLAHELLRQSEYRVLGAEPDEAKVHAGRVALDRADLYGDRITLQTESLDRLGYRDYAAAVVASDTILAEGRCPGSAAEMFRMVRPDGGVAILGQPAGCPKRLARDELTRWLDAAGLEYTITEDADGLWAGIRRGPLPGSGEWTHVRRRRQHRLERRHADVRPVRRPLVRRARPADHGRSPLAQHVAAVQGRPVDHPRPGPPRLLRRLQRRPTLGPGNPQRLADRHDARRRLARLGREPSFRRRREPVPADRRGRRPRRRHPLDPRRQERLGLRRARRRPALRQPTAAQGLSPGRLHRSRRRGQSSRTASTTSRSS